MPASTRLTAGTSRLLGRDGDLDRLRRAACSPEARIITLVGPGGVGKTRLAQELTACMAADPFTAVHTIPLSGVIDPSRVEAAISEALGLRDDHPETFLEQAAALYPRDRWLLLLDNFEHVIDAAPVIGELVRHCPTLTVLVTSRSPLRLADEWLVDVRPFDVANLTEAGHPVPDHPAVALFLDRCDRAGVTVDRRQLDHVHAICHGLDGLPLAIELAAGRARELPLATIADGIRAPLAILQRGPRDLPDRLQSLERSVAWSYGALPTATQRLFDRLSVFVGGFPIEGVAAMVAGRTAGTGYPWAGQYGGPHPDVARWGENPIGNPAEPGRPSLDRDLPLAPLDLDAAAGIAALVDQSLVTATTGRDGSTRYQILEPIRAFGLERLEQCGETAAVRHAQAAWACGFAEASSGGLWTTGLRRWGSERIDDELPNIRAALAWALGEGEAGCELALRTANALAFFWQLRGLTGEGLGWLERALEAGEGPDWIRAEALNSTGTFRWIRGHGEDATANLEAAAGIAGRIGNRRVEATSHFYLALFAWRAGDFLQMAEHEAIAWDLFAGWEDEIGLGVCGLAEGIGARMAGDLEAAAARFHEAIDRFGPVGFDWGIGASHFYLGEIDRLRGRPVDAADHFRESLRTCWGMADAWGSGVAIAGIAVLALGNGRWADAAQLFGASGRLTAGVGAFLPPTELEEYGRLVAAGRRLHHPLFAELEGAGGALGDDAAVDAALAVAAGLLGERSDDGWLDRANDRTRALVALAGLTPRQLAVLQLLLQDKEIKEISYELGPRYNTIHEHLQGVLRAFGAANLQQLVRLLDRTGVTELIVGVTG